MNKMWTFATDGARLTSSLSAAARAGAGRPGNRQARRLPYGLTVFIALATLDIL
jgi:hypothetical protein